MSYFVYCGAVNSDNYDNFPTHKIYELETKEQVIELYRKWRASIYSGDEAVIFRVFEGKEHHIITTKVETPFELIEKIKQ